MFLPGLGYPVFPKEMPEEEKAQRMAAFHRSERIGGRVALALLIVGLASAIFVFIAIAWRGL